MLCLRVYQAEAENAAKIMIPPYEREIYVIAMIKKKVCKWFVFVHACLCICMFITVYSLPRMSPLICIC